MKYTSEFNETDGICTVRVSGEFLRPDDSLVLRQFVYDNSAKLSCSLFLFDLTQATIKGEWTDAVVVITSHDEQDNKYAKVKAAIVYSSNLSDNKLIESVASTKGYLLAMFDDLDKAIEWLQM